MQALGPPHRNLVPVRRRDEAERSLLRQRAVPLPVEVHLAAELAVPPRVLARHVVGVAVGTRLDLLLLLETPFAAAEALVLLLLHRRHQALALHRIGLEQRLAPRRRQRVAERREDREEEEDHQREQRRRDHVQQPPLPRAPLRRRQAQVSHAPASDAIVPDLADGFAAPNRICEGFLARDF